VLLLSPTRENPYLQAGRAIYPRVCRSTALMSRRNFYKSWATRLDSMLPHTCRGDIAIETLNLSINQQDFPNEISDWQLLTEVRRGVV
jgi:hypothetical protein